MKRILKKCMFIMMMALMLSLFNVKSTDAADTTKPVIDNITFPDAYEGIFQLFAHDEGGAGLHSYAYHPKSQNVTDPESLRWVIPSDWKNGDT